MGAYITYFVQAKILTEFSLKNEHILKYKNSFKKKALPYQTNSTPTTKSKDSTSSIQQLKDNIQSKNQHAYNHQSSH